MLENLLLLDILKNPAILAAILAIIRNIGGYIYNCFEAKHILPYSATDFLVTLGIWETFFILFNGVASLPTEYTTVITAVIEVIRTFRKAVTDTTTPTQTPPLPALPEDAYPVKVGNTFLIADIQALITQGYTRWYFPDGHLYPIIVPSGLPIGQTMTKLGWVSIMPPGWYPIDTHQDSQ